MDGGFLVWGRGSVAQLPFWASVKGFLSKPVVGREAKLPCATSPARNLDARPAGWAQAVRVGAQILGDPEPLGDPGPEPLTSLISHGSFSALFFERVPLWFVHSCFHFIMFLTLKK